MGKNLILGFLVFSVGFLSILGCFNKDKRPASNNLEPSLSSPGSILSGTVRNAEGKVVSGVPVYLVSVFGGVPPVSTIREAIREEPLSQDISGQTYGSITDVSGKFVFQNVIDGEYNIIAQMGRDFSGLVKNVKVSAAISPAVTELNVELTPTGLISGEIGVPANFHLSGVIAFIPGTSYAAFTDEKGKFTISGVPAGAYSVAFYFPGLMQALYEGILVEPAKRTLLDKITLSESESVFLAGPAGKDGLSIVWKGTLALAPANPEVSWAYYDST